MIVFRIHNLIQLRTYHLVANLRSFFATSEATSSAKPNLSLYARVSEILASSSDRASHFARESRPLHRVVPLKRRTFHVGNQPDFCAARFVNPDFSRITKQKTLLKSRSSSVFLYDLEKLDRASLSYVSWAVAELLAFVILTCSAA